MKTVSLQEACQLLPDAPSRDMSLVLDGEILLDLPDHLSLDDLGDRKDLYTLLPAVTVKYSLGWSVVPPFGGNRKLVTKGNSKRQIKACWFSHSKMELPLPDAMTLLPRHIHTPLVPRRHIYHVPVVAYRESGDGKTCTCFSARY